MMLYWSFTLLLLAAGIVIIDGDLNRKCYDSSYFDSSTGQCEPPCTANCKGCTSATPTICNECKPRFFLYSGTCLACHDAYCLRCSAYKMCTRCEQRYFLTPIGICKPCGHNCYRCANTTNCVICVRGYYTTNGVCQICTGSCLICQNENNCEICVVGYYPDHGQCKACGTTCSECRVGFYGDTCQHDCSTCRFDKCVKERCTFGCKSGYYLDGEICNKCRNNCIYCSEYNTCTKCIGGRYGTTCQVECDTTNCTACERSSNNCTKCTSGFILQAGNMCCPVNCTKCDHQGNCLRCKEGFYGNVCNRTCNNKCKTCTTKDNCTECGIDRFDSKVDKGQCLCDKNQCLTRDSNGTCTSCTNEGWFLSKNGCCPCPNNCKLNGKCSAYSGSCPVGCQPGWWGVNCHKTCTVKHCINCTNGFCKLCEDGYHGDNCEQLCSRNCSKVPDQRVCDTKTGHCLFGCMNGTWGPSCKHTCGDNCFNRRCNSSSGECLPCIPTLSGPQCSKASISGQEHSYTWTIVGGCLLIVVVIVAVFSIRRRQTLCNRREDSNEQRRTDNTDPTSSQYEDIDHRPEQHMLNCHLRIDSCIEEENADPHLYESVQEANADPHQYESVQGANADPSQYGSVEEANADPHQYESVLEANADPHQYESVQEAYADPPQYDSVHVLEANADPQFESVQEAIADPSQYESVQEANADPPQYDSVHVLEANADPQFESVQENLLYETNTPDGKQYENPVI